MSKRSTDPIIGRTIAAVRQMTEEEAARFDFYSRPVILILDDGSFLLPMRDDEGNDGGALCHGTKSASYVYPVSRA